jgi:hypothetical protein
VQRRRRRRRRLLVGRLSHAAGSGVRPGAGAEGTAPIANTLRLRYKTLDTGVPMKTVDIEILLKAVETKVALVLFLALLVGFSALWFVTRLTSYHLVRA